MYIGKPRVEMYEAGMGVEATVNAERYYVPAARNNPTFDSFIPGEASLALQTSIARTHTLKKWVLPCFVNVSWRSTQAATGRFTK